MKSTINLYQFRDAFKSMDRNNFSYEGLAILFDAMEEYECSTGQEMELDVVALCCDYAEMSMEEVQRQYSSMFSHLDEPTIDQIVEALESETWVLGTTKEDTIVFSQF
jgi:aspartate/glutamate racemase